jgi:succinate-semialdehyde dehydrogenase/glutarate-semialdehyde dehydrogenase
VSTLPVELRDRSLLREQLFVGGRWEDGTGERDDVLDPATGQVVARVARGSRADARRAIDAAAGALPAWAAAPAKARAALLREWHDLIVEHVDDLAALLTAEQGKPLAEARGEILYGAAFVEWYAEEAKRAYGEVVPSPADGRRLLTLRRPVGVCAAITPWNFPMAMIARKAGPALAAGCTMVVKPAPATPLSALAMAALAERAGLPAGVLSVLCGPEEEIGGELVESPLVRKITFTGSTEVGRMLMAKAAATVKHVSLELGGNAPFIVFDDADVDAAVAGAIASKFRNAGQTCVCANRILVQDGIHEAFVERFAAATSALRVGNGFDERSEQGPLIDDRALAKVQEHIADAVSRGADVVCGGRPHALGGTFFEPTVLVGATPEMRLASEETFGPVAPVFRFTTEREAIAMANATESGLAAYFYARDLGRVWRVGEALEFGVVGVNTGIISYEGAPFGGVKQSGLGREGSRHGLDDYLEIKYLCLDGLMSAAGRFS